MSDLQASEAGGILRLHVDRDRKRNSLDADLVADLTAAMSAVTADVRVVYLTTAGEVFCAGADLSLMSDDVAEDESGEGSVSSTQQRVHEGRGGVRAVVAAMRACPAAVVVRVQGACLAGGFGLLLGSDVAIAADTATFGLPELNLGLWPFMVSALLVRHMSPKAAMELMLTGRRFSAAEAFNFGLVSRVVPHRDLDTQCDEFVMDLAGRAPLAIRAGKAAFWQLQDPTSAHDLADMEARLSLLCQTRDAAEGLTAFRERRAPGWEGQ
jgi:enoyl-CoA hydratase